MRERSNNSWRAGPVLWQLSCRRLPQNIRRTYSTLPQFGMIVWIFNKCLYNISTLPHYSTKYTWNLCTPAKSATTTNHITSDQRTLNALFWFYVTLSSWQRSILKNLSQFRCLLSPCCLVGLGLDGECVRGKALENDATALQSSYMTQHCWHNTFQLNVNQPGKQLKSL